MRAVVDFFWLLLGVAGACEVLLRLPVKERIAECGRVAGRALLRLSSPGVSDNWKALASRRYATRVLFLTAQIVLYLFASLFSFFVFIWIGYESLDAVFLQALRPAEAITLASFAVAYLLIRTRSSIRE
jgi:hypothetical protein